MSCLKAIKIAMSMEDEARLASLFSASQALWILICAAIETL
jgi:hypothetical protein